MTRPTFDEHRTMLLAINAKMQARIHTGRIEDAPSENPIALLEIVGVMAAIGLPCYVYLICDSAGAFLYAGKGTGDRFMHRIDEARRGASDRVATVLRSEMRAGRGFRFHVIAYYPDDASALAAERELIERIGRANQGTGPLINVQPGGNGFHRWSVEDRPHRIAACQRGGRSTGAYLREKSAVRKRCRTLIEENQPAIDMPSWKASLSEWKNFLKTLEEYLSSA